MQVMVQQVGEARTWAQSNLAVYQHKNSEAQAAVRGMGCCHLLLLLLVGCRVG